jgi:hypothetical protein
MCQLPAQSQLVLGVGPKQFFRQSLIGISVSEIQDKLVRLEQQSKQFKEDLFRISWYMRGGVTVNDLMHTYSFEDREMMYSIINENIEATKIAQMPLL